MLQLHNMFYFEVERYKAISLKQLSIIEISLAKVILIFIIIIKTTPDNYYTCEIFN